MTRSAVLPSVLAALAAFTLVSAAAMAQAPAPDAENGRYTFNPTSGGLLRLDTRTGQVALCKERTGGWACEASADDRLAFEAEIDRLRAENVRLKQEMIGRGIPLPSGMKPPSAGSELGLRLPTDEEVDHAMVFVEKLWRRLVDLVEGERKN